MDWTIKLTTLATWLLMASLGAMGGMEYQALKSAAVQSDTQVLEETGYINKAKTMPIYVDSTNEGVY
jgi:sensor domain CHASE-containing protein